MGKEEMRRRNCKNEAVREKAVTPRRGGIPRVSQNRENADNPTNREERGHKRDENEKYRILLRRCLKPLDCGERGTSAQRIS